jgi:hypothetical protein
VLCYLICRCQFEKDLVQAKMLVSSSKFSEQSFVTKNKKPRCIEDTQVQHSSHIRLRRKKQYSNKKRFFAFSLFFFVGQKIGEQRRLNEH